MKIVVRAPNWIGDSILAIPVLESLRKNYPDVEIHIAANVRVIDLFTVFDFVESIIPLPAKSNFKNLRESSELLKSYKFDAGLLLTNSFASALLFYLAKIPNRWGYQYEGRQILLTKAVAKTNREKSLHQVHYYLNLVAGLGLSPASPNISFPLNSSILKDAAAFLSSENVPIGNTLITLNPGAYYGSAKRWPEHKFSQLAILLQEKFSSEILIIGSADEIALAENIAAPMKKKPHILAGKTSLPQLAGVIAKSNLCISNDTGPMHLAVALKVPTVAIFGPTNPDITGPFQEPSDFIKKEVPCWPCTYRECPFDHRCMQKIKPVEVLRSCQKLLS